jgi:hypothetical protein
MGIRESGDSITIADCSDSRHPFTFGSWSLQKKDRGAHALIGPEIHFSLVMHMFRKRTKFPT